MTIGAGEVSCCALGARAREGHHRFDADELWKHIMDKTFVLTVDVEIDAGPKWRTSNPATYEGIPVGIASLQRLCDAYGVKPVYLINDICGHGDSTVLEVPVSITPTCGESGAA